MNQTNLEELSRIGNVMKNAVFCNWRIILHAISEIREFREKVKEFEIYEHERMEYYSGQPILGKMQVQIEELESELARLQEILREMDTQLQLVIRERDVAKSRIKEINPLKEELDAEWEKRLVDEVKYHRGEEEECNGAKLYHSAESHREIAVFIENFLRANQ